MRPTQLPARVPLALLAAAGLAMCLASVTAAQDAPAPAPSTQPADKPLPDDEPLNPIMPGAEYEAPPPADSPAKANAPTKGMTPRREPRPAVPGTARPELEVPNGQQNGGSDAGAVPGAAFPPLGPDEFSFGPFSDPVDLKILLDAVREEFELPMIATDTGFIGQKVLIPVRIVLKKHDVIPFMISLLEQRGYTLSRNAQGIYVVSPIGDGPVWLGNDQYNTTRVIPTPGLKPSAMQSVMAVLNFGGGGKAPTTVFMDDLGVILMTGSSGQIALVEALVTKLVEEQSLVRQQRFEVHHIAANVARDRIVELASGSQAGRPGAVRTQPRTQGGTQGDGDQKSAPVSLTSTGLLAIDDRLTVDPQTNALYYRGRRDELERFSDLLKLVDAPNALVSRWYPVGGAADAIANAGRREGLGNIILEEGNVAQSASSQPANRTPVPGQPQTQTQYQYQEIAGAGFIIYPQASGFVYRGTESQHERVKALVAELRDLATQELIVVEFYKLKHANSVEAAELINNLVTGQQARGQSPLLGRSGQGSQRSRDRSGINRSRDPRQSRDGENLPADQRTNNPAGATGGADALNALFADENTSIIADEKNNQIIVRAPKRVQPQYAKLIDRIDVRRPQVFIDAQIVAVTDNEDFRLAFENQILAGEFAYNSNFGLGTLAAQGLQTKKGVNTGALGLTAALIKSDQVPIIINALQQNVDGRILSTPQILVDDNEEASITRKDRIPTSVASQSSNTTITSTGADAEAGTDFTVKPTISEIGLRLDYSIELSSFTGAASSPGLPPPSQAVNINGIVTVPSDATVVVGGLTVENLQNTVLKIPLLGDIPILGYLFRDTSKTAQNVRVYIFLTPRVLRDPTFADLRLLTRGPMDSARVDDIDLPPPQPVRVDILDVLPTAPAPAAAAPSSSEREPGSGDHR